MLEIGTSWAEFRIVGASIGSIGLHYGMGINIFRWSHVLPKRKEVTFDELPYSLSRDTN
jgi:hypothetical protein